MGEHYRQLSLEERCTIARLHENGQSYRKIAASLGRAPSTIAREITRNKGNKVGYKPAYADELTWARRWRGCLLQRQPELQQTVLTRLAMGWPPEQAAGRLTLENASTRISHESIYRFIYAQIRATKNYAWRQVQTRLSRQKRRKLNPAYPTPRPNHPKTKVRWKQTKTGPLGSRSSYVQQ